MHRFAVTLILACVEYCKSASAWLKRIAAALLAIAWGIADPSDLTALSLRYWETDPDWEEAAMLGGCYPWEEAVYAAHLPSHGRIGLIGCGAGRDVLALARQGHAVEGVDVSNKLIQAARRYCSQAQVDAELFCADVRAFEFPKEAYDAFIFSNFTYGYLPGSLQRVRILKRLRRKLAPDGRVILFYYKMPHRQDGRLNRLARWTARLMRTPNPPEPGDRLDLDYQFQHVFVQDEITREAAQAGYELLEVGPLAHQWDFAVILSRAETRITVASGVGAALPNNKEVLGRSNTSNPRRILACSP